MCGIMLTTKPWSIANPLRKPSVICHSNAARFWPDEKFASPFNFYRHKAVADAMKRGPAAFGNPYSAQESKSSVRKPLRRDISNCPITADADIFDFEIHFARLVYTKAIFIGKSGLVCEKVAGRPAATSPNSPARTGWPRPSSVKSLRFSSKASPVG